MRPEGDLLLRVLGWIIIIQVILSWLVAFNVLNNGSQGLRTFVGALDRITDPLYRPMSGNEETSLAFQAARALVFEGVSQPNGYTEPLLHAFRRRLKDETA